MTAGIQGREQSIVTHPAYAALRFAISQVQPQAWGEVCARENRETEEKQRMIFEEGLSCVCVVLLSAR